MNITKNGDSSQYNNTGYYLTPDLSQRLDLISHLLANTHLIPFVQAGEGCGKTRLADHLAETLSERYSIFRIDGESTISAKALRSKLSEETGSAAYEVIDDEQLLRQIMILAEQDKALLILVDDVESLPAETLTWLTELLTERKNETFIKCVIFAEVDVLALPLSPVLLSTLKDNIQTLDIPHITSDQLPGFVASIDPLKSAVIDEAQYATLMKNSSGVIGKILWQLQYIDNNPVPQQEIDISAGSKMKPLYVVAGILFVSALTSVLIFQDEINRNISEKSPAEQEKQLEVINLPLPPKVVAVEEKAGVQPEVVDQPDEILIPEPDKKETVTGLPAEVPKNEPVDVEPEVLVPEEDDNELKVEPEAESEIESETVPEAVPGQETAGEVPRVEPVVSEKTQKQPVQEKIPAESPLQKPAVSKQKKERVYQSVDWLLSQSDKNYTLQLLAVSEAKGIKRFLEQHTFGGNLVIMKTTRNGKPWYALLFESYASRDEALKARKNLPKSYKSSSAWPRSIKSIRQAIGAN